VALYKYEIIRVAIFCKVFPIFSLVKLKKCNNADLTEALNQNYRSFAKTEGCGQHQIAIGCSTP
jgi:hypothetical protein